jgi:hypothetical protein
VANLFAIDSFARPWGERKQAIERAVATVTSLPGVEQVPGGTRLDDPQDRFEPEWVAPIEVLLALRDHGDLPDWAPPSEAERLEWGSVLLVREVAAAPATDCSTDVSSIAVDRPLVVGVQSADGGTLTLRLVSRTTGDAGPVRQFALDPGQPLAVELGLAGVDASVDAPPGTAVCTAG